MSTHLIPPNKYIIDAENRCGNGLWGMRGTREPKIGAIGHVSREIEREVWGHGANEDENGGGLENVSGGAFSESRRQWDNRERAWTSLGDWGRHG
jgi:hypothetical protein